MFMKKPILHMIEQDVDKGITSIKGKKVLNSFNANKCLIQAIRRGKPYWAGRYGQSSLWIGCYQIVRYWIYTGNGHSSF